MLLLLFVSVVPILVLAWYGSFLSCCSNYKVVLITASAIVEAGRKKITNLANKDLH